MKKTVLVVDDEPLLREIVRDFLEKAGFEVTESGNGQEAWETISDRKIDCIISDIRMPNGSGVELVKNVFNHYKDEKPKLILMTGYSDVTFDQMKEFGVLTILSKPFEPDDVVRHVCKALGENCPT